MKFDSNRNYHNLLSEGIRAARDGSKNLAWTLLTQATKLNPVDATPWLWLTETTDDISEKIDYLEQALAADPRNFSARKGLAALKGQILDEREVTPDSSQSEQPGGKPAEVKPKETFMCPRCGAHMEFNLHANALTCGSCGFFNQPEDRSAADKEQYMESVLRTESGHRWAVTQKQMVCGQCGAHSLWPPEQVAAACPYCGSSHLIESDETEGLVDPQAIAIMQVDEREAVNTIIEWLEKGLMIPNDLKKSAQRTHLRPAYYPFWTFDGTMDIHWACEVNGGTSNNPRWESRSGVEYEMFDDVLIPGLTSLSFKEMNKLGKYNLKDVVEFQPDYVAGWPALTYNRPLSKATLLAREHIIRRVRPQLYSRVLLGQQKRGLNTGGVNWSDMTFKHVLLPVWIGKYKYKGTEYQVMINGQTGVITGEKPRDAVKTLGIFLSVIATIIFLGMIGFIIATSLGWF